MSMSRVIIGLLLIAIGLSAVTRFDFVKILLAFLFIFWGISILGNRSYLPKVFQGKKKVSQNDLNEVTIFGAADKKISSKSFGGGKIVVVFGGGDIDLVDVVPTGKHIEVELVAIFGGLKLIVPQDWYVTTEGVGIIGGFSNGTAVAKDAKFSLTVKGAAIFGGVEIVNG